jgi:hypothetical protein
MSTKPVNNLEELTEKLYADFNQTVAEIESCDNPKIKATLQAAEGEIAQAIVAAEKKPINTTTTISGGSTYIYKRG